MRKSRIRSWQDEYIDQLKRGEFFPISNTLFKYRMKPVERCVYLYLVSLGGVSKKCFPAMPTIAMHCCCCENTAREAVDALVAGGFITKKETYRPGKNGVRQANNVYEILDLPPLEGRMVQKRPKKKKALSAKQLKGKKSNLISEIYKDQLPKPKTA